MKFIAVPILTLLILIQTLSKWVLIAEYEINRDYIAKNLCENKSKPASKCHGKCQLMKKMTADEDRGATPGKENTGKEKFPEVLYFEEFANTDVDLMPSTTKSTEYFFPNYVSPEIPVFHPPA